MSGERYVSERFFKMVEGLVSDEVSSLAEHLYDGDWKSATPDQRAKYYVIAQEAIAYLSKPHWADLPDYDEPPF